jgi:hypothetical protein
MGCYLFKFCYENLTEEQRNRAFDNAINNNMGHHLFKFGYEKLTEEQKKILKDN